MKYRQDILDLRGKAEYMSSLLPFARDMAEHVIARVIRRLMVQPDRYQELDRRRQLSMEYRALLAASCTFNTTTIMAARLIRKGCPAMDSSLAFMGKRFKTSPKEWGNSPKSNFAKALAGYSLGEDAVCLDRHLMRLGHTVESIGTAPRQWETWFRLALTLQNSRFGITLAMIRWHGALLDWIALRTGPPKPFDEEHDVDVSRVRGSRSKDGSLSGVALGPYLPLD